MSRQGLVRNVRQIKVRIPKGIDTGTKIQMRGEGEAGVNGGPPGDLFVIIHVASHELFVRENNDLVARATVSFPQAALGTTIEIPTIDGTAKLTIPSGTQFGARLRIPHKGVPYYNHYGSGDLIVQIQVETPTNLTEQEKRFWKHLCTFAVKVKAKNIQAFSINSAISFSTVMMNTTKTKTDKR